MTRVRAGTTRTVSRPGGPLGSRPCSSSQPAPKRLRSLCRKHRELCKGEKPGGGGCPPLGCCQPRTWFVPVALHSSPRVTHRGGGAQLGHSGWVAAESKAVLPAGCSWDKSCRHPTKNTYQQFARLFKREPSPITARFKALQLPSQGRCSGCEPVWPRQSGNPKPNP